MKKLRVGDTVVWKGDFGGAASKLAVIESIEDMAKDIELEEIEWSKVNNRNIEVTMSNNHWAYGTQIKPITK
jgi:hypothetical protein